MGLLVRVLRGVWKKSGTGEWGFLTRPGEMAQENVLQENESYERLLEIVRATYHLDDNTKLALTFQFPDWMLKPNGN
ncbi:unnamed protein product [Arabis nemorensis]|uniref:Uncharacterized protein n=1 Tax=Arabis nemorensis TaxID=586526 RepID=A0A565ARR3_9BRAS|nr:unnamed protein product [Arabis nemorensis]